MKRQFLCLTVLLLLCLSIPLGATAGFRIVSGNNQTGTVREVLAQPFVIIATSNLTGKPSRGWDLTFRVTEGGGSLSITSATTDDDGLAQTTLTLGNTPGTNVVEVVRDVVGDVIATFRATATSPTVNIPDDNLRAAIETILGKEKNDPITETEIGSFFTLSANDAEISNLSGLEYATRLLGLSLKDNEISNLSPLSGLQLITVYLSGNDITSISALSRMIQIRTLYLDNNRITSLSSLPNLSSASILSFQDNRITDISPLLNDDLGFEGSRLGGGGRDVYLDGNPLSDTSINTHIPALEARSITVHFSAPTVNIPDANLRAVIEAELGKEKNDPITEAEIRSITRLVGTDAEISSLSGLEHATSLEVLHLQHNEISSLSPLSGLTSLTFLDVEFNEISSLSLLSGLTSLEVLDLEGNEISSLSPLSGLTSLTFLDLQHNEISSLSPLSGLTQLTVVLLSGNNITSISALSRIKNIIKLSLANNRITSLSSLPNLGSVYELSLQDNRITDISPLLNDDLGFRGGNFRNVHLDGNPLSDTSINTHIPALEARSITVHFSAAPTVNIPDANLRAVIEAELGKEKNDPITEAEIRSITRLVGTDAEISSLSGLEHATSLEVLFLQHNEISSLSPLSGLTSLTFLDVEFNEISSLSPLSGLTSLEVLDLEGNEISSLSPLSGLTSLTFLDLQHNEISSLSPLSGLTQLTVILLSGNNITSISELSRMIQIIKLSLANNRITSLSSLPNLGSVYELSLQDNRITDISPLLNDDLGFRGGNFRNVYLDGNPLSDTSINTHIPALEARSITVHFSAPTVNIPDDNLRAAIETILGKEKNDPITEAEIRSFRVLSANDAEISNLSGLEYATRLLGLSLKDNEISSLSPLSGLTQLITVLLSGNDITSISALSRIKNINRLYLDNNRITSLSSLPNLSSASILSFQDNRITDISPLLNDDLGFEGSRLGGGGRDVYLDGNPLSDTSINTHIPALEARSITVHFSVTDPPKTELNYISGADQTGEPGKALEEAFVVEVKKADEAAANVYVTFTVTFGGGSMSSETVKTDSNGLARSTLTLGPNAGTNTVEVTTDTVPGDTVTFTATATEKPVFTGVPYNFSIPEDSLEGTSVGTVSATVSDGDVEYELHDGDDNDSFRIGRDTGQLTSAETFNYEEQRSYSLGIRATGPSGSEDTVATVTITEMEDEIPPNATPTFSDEIATFTVSSDASVGTDVGTVPATDDDDDTLTYDLSGSDSSSFAISSTGVLTTAAVLTEDTTYHVTVTVNDGNGGTDTIEVTIEATGSSNPTPTPTPTPTPNNEPTFTDGDRDTRSIPEHTVAGRDIGLPVAATDQDSEDTLTYSLGGEDAAAFDIDTATGQLKTKAPLDFETTPAYTVIVTVSDGKGGSDSIRVTINITRADDTDGDEDSNTAPTFNDDPNAVRSIPENTVAGRDIGTPVSATDTDSEDLTYSLGGDDAAAFDIDAATGQLKTKAPLDFETKPAYTVIVTVSDGEGGSASITVTITLTNVNEVPSFTDGTNTVRSIAEHTAEGEDIGTPVSATDTDSEDLTYSLGGDDAAAFDIDAATGQLKTKAPLDFETTPAYTVIVTVSDGEGGSASITVTITLTNVNEVPSFTDGTNTVRSIAEHTAAGEDIGLPVAATDQDGDTGTYTLSGADAAAFDIDAATGQLKTKAPLDFETKPAYTVIVTVSDGNGGSASITVTITLTDANEVPSFTDGPNAVRSIAEHTAEGEDIGTPVSATDTDSEDLTYRLGGEGAAAFDIDAATGQLKTKAPLDFETKPAYTVIVTVSDGEGGSASITVTITLTNVNEVPSFTDGTNTVRSIAEHTAAGEDIGLPVAATDQDGDTGTYTLSGADAAAFDIDAATGQLKTKAPLDFETKPAYTVIVTVSDGNGGSDSITVTIELTDVNDAPIFDDGDSRTRSIAENTVAGEDIGAAVSATDQDGDTLTYTLSGGTDSESFTIVSSTGQLRTAVALTAGTYNVTVTADDGRNGTAATDVTITVIAPTRTVIVPTRPPRRPPPPPSNNAPVFSADSGGTREIVENTAAGVNIGAPVSATDADNDPLTYSLDSVGAATFDINTATGQLTTQANVVLDHERIPSYAVTVTVQDGRGGVISIGVTIQVTNVNEPPTFSDDLSTTFEIDENTAAGVNIDTPVSATDADNDTLTYTLSGADAAAFEIDMNTGQLRTKAVLDHETQSTYNVMVTVSDGTLAVTIEVTITVTNINEMPTFNAGASTTRSITENVAVGTAIGPPVAATDPDGDTLTYTLSGADAAAFDIDAATGQLKTQAPLDFETKPAYDVMVTVSDGTLADTIEVTITVTNINEMPTFNEGASTTRSITENVAVGTAIGPPVAATDPDIGDTVTYTLSGADAAAFELDMLTGQLSTVTILNSETKDTYTVTVTASDGTLMASITVTVTVTDLDEFLWSIPQGLSLIHVPLKVTAVDGVAKTLETITNLYIALGGTTNVNLLVTRDTAGDRWLSYLGAINQGKPGDKTLTDDLGILVDMKNSVTVELSGDPLGMNGMSAITLREGLNLVGVPLKDSRLTRVSDLFALEGIAGNVSEVLTWDGVAKVITHAGDEDDGPLTGGQSFFLEASEMATVAISGTGWYNSTGINAAPLIAANALRSVGTTPVLAVTGSIAVDAPGGNYRVTVKNLSTGTVNTVTVRDAGDFQLTLVDVVGGVAQIGDILEVTAESSDPSIGVQPLHHIVTAKDVQRSVIQLDALLAYAIPSQTELLHNYPNPFNPETWIPYRLASDANVTLTIYDQHGGVVRKLDVGHRGAAVYERRDKAIYWDGKNEFGERVASGVYFYHLSAGDYSATRKMVIVK